MSKLGHVLHHLRFVIKKPRVLIRIFQGFFKKIVLGQEVLRTVDWAVTYDCNYACNMCSATLLRDVKRDYLTINQMADIWGQCKKLGVIHVNLTGGEPLTRDTDDLCEIIKNFNPKEFLVSMVTNGHLLTRDKLKKLRDSGLDTIQFSLESMDPEKNDSIRKVGSYNAVMDGIRWAKELGLNVCVSAVLTKDNIGEMDDMVRFTRGKGVFLLICPAASAGRWLQKSQKKLDIKSDFEEYSRLIKLSHVRTDTIFNFNGRRGCPGGKERVYISAYGDVMTCPYVHIAYGNVLKEPVGEIWKRMNNMPTISHFSPICKHAFDEDYLEKYLKPIEKSKKMPIPWLDHPALKDMKYQFTKFDKDIYESKNPIIRVIFSDKIRKIKSFLPDGRILDVGCGEGYVLREVTSKNRIGCDVDRRKIEWGKKNFNVDIVYSNAEDLKFADRSFDAVICSEVLEHVLDVDGTLLEIKRVLKKDGILVVTLPREFIINLGKRIIGRKNIHPHLREMGDIESKLAKHFHIERVKNTFLFVHKVYLLRPIQQQDDS